MAPPRHHPLSSLTVSIDRRNRVHFEESADFYNESRFPYPAPLIDDILALSNIPPNGRILEIGCGPGNATLPFARRNFQITAVELGPKLAAIAAQNLAPYPAVQVIQSAFETLPLQEETFDLALSANAFHWIPPEIGYPKAASALKPGGSLICFWNIHVEPETEPLKTIYRTIEQLAPHQTKTEKEVTAQWLTNIIPPNFKRDPRFGPVTVKQHRWQQSYTTGQYLSLLQTNSFYRTLDQQSKAQLFSAVRTHLKPHNDTITIPKQAVLFHAQR